MAFTFTCTIFSLCGRLLDFGVIAYCTTGERGAVAAGCYWALLPATLFTPLNDFASVGWLLRCAVVLRLPVAFHAPHLDGFGRFAAGSVRWRIRVVDCAMLQRWFCSVCAATSSASAPVWLRFSDQQVAGVALVLPNIRAAAVAWVCALRYFVPYVSAAPFARCGQRAAHTTATVTLPARLYASCCHQIPATGHFACHCTV